MASPKPVVQLVEPSADLLKAGGAWPYILDVRTEGERLGDLGHMPASHHLNSPEALSVSSQDLPGILPHKPSLDTPILVVCRSGVRANAVALHLRAAGFTTVGNMQGGMLAWERLGLPKVQVSLTEKSDQIRALTPNEVRDMILECFVDSTLKYYSADLHGRSAQDSVRLAFEQEAGKWDNPPREKFSNVLRALAEIARDQGHPIDAITEHLTEFSSLLATWLAQP